MADCFGDNDCQHLSSDGRLVSGLLRGIKVNHLACSLRENLVIGVSYMGTCLHVNPRGKKSQLCAAESLGINTVAKSAAGGFGKSFRRLAGVQGYISRRDGNQRLI